jgi:5-methylcytosine-specific restriction endonuclease McrA
MRSWEKTRQQVLQRDDYTCQSCFGFYQTGFPVTLREQLKYLDVHHKVKTPFDNSDDLDDLVTVCDHCHKEQENSIKLNQPRKIWIEESTRKQLNKMAYTRCETYNDVILRLIDFWNKEFPYVISHYDTQSGIIFTFKQHH